MKSYPVKSYIIFHITWATAFVSLIAFALVTYNAALEDQAKHAQNLESRLEGYVQILSTLLRSADYIGLTKTAPHLLKDENLDTISVTTDQSYTVVQVSNDFVRGDGYRSQHKRFPVYSLADNDEILGYVEFDYSLSQQLFRIPSPGVILPTLLACLLLAYLVNFFLRRSVEKPVVELHAMVKNSSGRSLPEMTTKSPRELDELHQSIQTLLAMVHARTQEVDEKNQKLKEQIKNTQETQQALFQLQKREVISNLASGISHDFNNLLMVILGNLELIQLKLNDDALKKPIDNAINTVFRGADLTSNLLAVSRAKELEPKNISITSVLEQQKSWVSRILPDNVEVGWEIPDKQCYIYVDESLFVSALLNLIINARDALQSSGKVTISLTESAYPHNDQTEPTEPSDYYRLVVADNGMGMPDSVKRRVLEPFFTTKGKNAGTGLGLSMVERFVSDADGMLEIESQSGVGTSIILYFPKSTHESDTNTASRHADELIEFNHQRILIVEDDIDIGPTLESLLNNENLRPTLAASAEAAQQQFRPGDYDIALIDTNLPGAIQGDQLAADLKQQDPKLSVIMMSANISKILQYGNKTTNTTWPFIKKPFTRMELLIKISKAVRELQKA